MNVATQPNMNHRDWMNGRHWAVAYRCRRRGKTHCDLYDPKGPHDGNLQEQKPPDGLRSILGMLLCPECSESYKAWMDEGKSEEAE